MRFLIFLFITFLVSTLSFAQNGAWRNLDDLSNSKAHWSKKECEKVHIQCDFALDIRRVKKSIVNDLNRPIFRAPKDSPVLLNCADFNDCLSKANNPDGNDETDDGVCNSDGSQERWDMLASHPNVTGRSGPWFIWCEKATGSFYKKGAFVPNSEGIAAADTADSKAKENRKTRREKKEVDIIVLLQCAKDAKSRDITPSEVTKCVASLIKLRLGNRLPISSL